MFVASLASLFGTAFFSLVLNGSRVSLPLALRFSIDLFFAQVVRSGFAVSPLSSFPFSSPFPVRLGFSLEVLAIFLACGMFCKVIHLLSILCFRVSSWCRCLGCQFFLFVPSASSCS